MQTSHTLTDQEGGARQDLAWGHHAGWADRQQFEAERPYRTGLPRAAHRSPSRPRKPPRCARQSTSISPGPSRLPMSSGAMPASAPCSMMERRRLRTRPATMSSSWTAAPAMHSGSTLSAARLPPSGNSPRTRLRRCRPCKTRRLDSHKVGGQNISGRAPRPAARRAVASCTSSALATGMKHAQRRGQQISHRKRARIADG